MMKHMLDALPARTIDTCPQDPSVKRGDTTDQFNAQGRDAAQSNASPWHKFRQIERSACNRDRVVQAELQFNRLGGHCHCIVNFNALRGDQVFKKS
jgi:hypothetical protein